MKELFTEEEFDLAKSRDTLPLECFSCGETFTLSKNHIQAARKPDTRRSGNYCSKECQYASMRKRVDTSCHQCGKGITRAASQANRGTLLFCSQSCSATYNNGRRTDYAERRTAARIPCLQCGKDTLNKEFCSYSCLKEYGWSAWVTKIEAGENLTGSISTVRDTMRRYLIEKHGHVCVLCGLAEWKGEPIPLNTDHIDGDSSNNVLSNFRMVCPNCDRLLPTSLGRNRGKGPRSREKNMPL